MMKQHILSLTSAIEDSSSESRVGSLTYYEYPSFHWESDESITIKGRFLDDQLLFQYLRRKALKRAQAFSDHLIQLIMKEKITFDFIVSDTLALWSLPVAKHFGRPLVGSHITFIASPGFFLGKDDMDEESQTVLEELRVGLSSNIQSLFIPVEPGAEMCQLQVLYHSFQLQPNLLTCYPRDQLVANSDDAKQMITTFNENSKGFIFCGAPLAPSPVLGRSSWKSIRQPLIYVSMGTVVTKLELDTYEMVLRACNEMVEFKTLVSCSRDPGVLNALSPFATSRVSLELWVDQCKLLDEESTVLFITHGGMGSARESILSLVPTIFFPSFLDQAKVAEQVEALGCGIAIKHMDLAGKNEDVGMHFRSALQRVLERYDSMVQALDRARNELYSTLNGKQTAEFLLQAIGNGSRSELQRHIV